METPRRQDGAPGAMGRVRTRGGAARFVLVVCMTVLVGCGADGERTAHAPRTLTLLCGGGVRPPMDGSGVLEEPGALERFLALHDNVRVETIYGASNLLLQQLMLTETGDLFLPGDDFYIEEAKKRGLVSTSRHVAWFVPVIMVRDGNPLGIRSVSDLAAPHVRLAVADARAAAIGRITPEILARNGLVMEALDNIAFTAVTAPEIAQAVSLGHVDAAIVWRPVAEQYPHRTAIVEIDPENNVVSPLVIAVLETSDHKDLAREFVDFLSGPEGRRIFERYHYSLEAVDGAQDAR